MGTAREPIFDWKPLRTEVKSFDVQSVRRTVAKVEGEVTYLDNKATDTNTARAAFTAKHGFYYLEDLCLPLRNIQVVKISDSACHVVATYQHTAASVPNIDIDLGMSKRTFQRTIEWIPSFGLFSGTAAFPAGAKTPNDNPVVLQLSGDSDLPFQLRPIRWTQILWEFKANYLLTIDPEINLTVINSVGTTNADPIMFGDMLRAPNTMLFVGPSTEVVETYDDDPSTGSKLRYAGYYRFIYNEHSWIRTVPVLLGFPGPGDVQYDFRDEYKRTSWALKPQVAPQDPNIPFLPSYTPNCA